MYMGKSEMKVNIEQPDMHISNHDATRLDDNGFLLLFDKREVCQNAALMTKFSKHIL